MHNLINIQTSNVFRSTILSYNLFLVDKSISWYLNHLLKLGRKSSSAKQFVCFNSLKRFDEVNVDCLKTTGEKQFC